MAHLRHTYLVYLYVSILYTVNIQQRMPLLKRHIARLKQIKELSSIKRKKYSHTEISEYQNEVSSDKLEEDSDSEISEKELEMT